MRFNTIRHNGHINRIYRLNIFTDRYLTEFPYAQLWNLDNQAERALYFIWPDQKV